MDEDQFKTRLKIAKNKTDKDKKSEEGNKGSSMGSAFKMRTEFEDGLRTGVRLGDCWCPWGGRTYPRINFKPLWGCGLVLG